MFIPEGFVDELRSRVSIVDFIAKRIPSLKKAGKIYKGLCPFHGEKTPSFTVTAERNTFHCFGCGLHGDIIGFMMNHDSIDFLSAVERIAREYGIPIPESTKEYSFEQKKRKEIYDTLEFASDYYHKLLFSSKGKAALDYLNQRKIDIDLIKKFKLGFSVSTSKSLFDELCKQGFSIEAIVEAGLVNKDDKGSYYDYFKNRLMIPIFDKKGKVVAFGARTLLNVTPKYINSRETQAFKKSELLYGYNFLPQNKKTHIVMVEGYMDVIAFHKAGLPIAVAPLGTAVTTSHLQLIWELNDAPIVCLDGDKAGQEAARRLINIALPIIQPGKSLKFSTLPKDMDPDDIVNSKGAAALKQNLSEAKLLSNFIFDNAREGLDLSVPENILELKKKLKDITELIKNFEIKSIYNNYFYTKIREITSVNTGKKYFNNYIKTDNIKQDKIFSVLKKNSYKNAADKAEHCLIAIVVNYPELLQEAEVFEEFLGIQFNNTKLDKIYQNILQIKDLNENIFDGLKKRGFTEELLLLNSLVSNFINELKVDYSKDKLANIWKYLLNNLHLENIKQEYNNSIKIATNNAMEKAVGLSKEITKLQRLEEEFWQNFSS